MFHFFNNIRGEWSFIGGWRAQTEDNLIYVTDQRYYDEIEHREGQLYFTQLDEAISEFGSWSEFMEALLAFEDDTYLVLDETEFYKAALAHIRSIYPKMALETVYRLLQIVHIHHRLIKPDPVYAESLQEVESPDFATIRDFDRGALFGEGYSHETRLKIGYEYLLAHVLASDFQDDPFTRQFVQQLDALLWKSVARDFIKMRGAILFNAHQVNKNFPFHFDFRKESIKENFTNGRNKVFFNPEVTHKDVDYVKQHASSIVPHIRKVLDLYVVHEETQKVIMDLLQPERCLTIDEARTIIASDRDINYWSYIFGRKQLNKDTNATMINYFYSTDPEKLQEFRLDT